MTALNWVITVTEIITKTAESDEKVVVEAMKEPTEIYDSFPADERQRVIDILNQNFEAQDLVYICSFFSQFIKRKELIQLLFSALMSMEMDPELAIMIKLQLDYLIDGYDDEKREFNKRVVNLLSDSLQLKYRYQLVSERNQKSIVIITEQMLDTHHAPTKRVFDYACAMRKSGYKVMIFSCVSDSQRIIHAWSRPFVLSADNSFDHIKWRRIYNGETFEGYQINLTENCLKEYNMMVDLICAINPLFVYSIGCANPVVEVLNCFTDVVCHKFRNGLPVSECKTLVEVGSKECGVFCRPDGVTIVRPAHARIHYPSKEREYSRDELQLPENAFLIAIVGNRLVQEIDTEFVSVMEQIQTSCPDVCYVLVGVELDRLSVLENSNIKFIKWGYADDLAGVLSVVDLYLNPFRKGGGYSAGVSLCVGTPVVSLPDCDVAINTGADFTVERKEDVPNTVIKYINDDDFYSAMKEKTVAFAKNHTEDAFYSDLSKEIQVLRDVIVKGGESKNV